MGIGRWAGCVVIWMGVGVGCASCAPRPAVRAGSAVVARAGVGALAVDRGGNVYVGGRGVEKFDAAGRGVTFDAGAGAVEAMVADEEYLYCAGGGRIERFSLAGGKRVPFSGGAGAISVVSSSVAAMDVAGTTLYVADAKLGSVRMFDTETGETRGEFSAPAPTAVAVDAIGQIWVAYDHGTIRAFRSDGYAGVTYAGAGDVAGMAFGAGGKLYVADGKGRRVVTPGDADSGSVFADVVKLGGEVRAVAVDGEGKLVTLERGGRVAKWSATGELLWERRVNDRAARP